MSGAVTEQEVILRGETPVTIGNEFAYVQVRKVYTRNGERLEISAPKLGYRILLCPLELESLSWQDHSLFSSLLQDPYGSIPGSN